MKRITTILLVLLSLLLVSLPTAADTTRVPTLGGGDVTAVGANAFTGANSFLDGANFKLKNTATPTKILQFDLTGFSAGTKTVTFPDSATLAVCTAGSDCAPTAAWSFTNIVTMSNGSALFRFVNSGQNISGFFNNSGVTPNATTWGVGTISNSAHFMEFGDDGFDWDNGPCGTSACTDPTLIFHSHNQTTTQWLSLTHNATDAVVATGLGGIDYTGVIGAWKLNRTITAGGTTGAQTINKISGTVNFAAAAATLVVTDSLVTTSSIIFAVLRTADTTCTLKNVVPASGSFTITMTAGCAAETSVGFRVDN